MEGAVVGRGWGRSRDGRRGKGRAGTDREGDKTASVKDGFGQGWLRPRTVSAKDGFG